MKNREDLENELKGKFEAYLNQEKSILTPLSFKEISADTPPPLEYVLYPCIPQQGICFIYAATGVGKTLFTLNIAYTIAGGSNFLKYSSPKLRKVLYIDGEMSYIQLHSRLMHIVQQQGKLYEEDNFLILTPDKILPHSMPMIDTKEGQELYKKIIEEYGIDVIIFDNVSVLSSFDENKSAEWKPIQDWFLQLRAWGKTLIVVHHAGKDKNGYRGSSKMLDCADTAISLQPVETDEDNTEEKSLGKKFKIVYQKARSFAGHEALPFEAILHNNLWSYQSIEISLIEKIAACVNAKMTQREIAKELFISQTKVNRLIKEARFKGLIKD